MDWERVFARLEEDTAVLAAVTTLFRWMCPGRAAELPEWIWKKLGLIPEGRPAPGWARLRTRLFKDDNWFTADILMQIGAMNNPAHGVLEEIEWIAALGLDFLDLTLEPPSGRTLADRRSRRYPARP